MNVSGVSWNGASPIPTRASVALLCTFRAGTDYASTGEFVGKGRTWSGEVYKALLKDSSSQIVSKLTTLTGGACDPLA